MICDASFEGFVMNTILPLTVYAGIVTSIFIAFSLMAGRVLSNPKLDLWAKTETVQLFISIASVFFIMIMVSGFCSADISEVASIFGFTTSSANIYDAAENYLLDAAKYAHNAMTVTRYHLEGYTVMSYLNAFMCDFRTGQIGWGCYFGYSGANQQPFGGYGATMAALNIFFNSTIISFFSAMNFLFILMFVQEGFVTLFLPLGIFLRAMPYLRTFGSLLIALALSFLIVYPLLLGVLGIMGDVLLDRPSLVPAVGSGTPLGNYLYSCNVPNDYCSGRREVCECRFPGEEGAGSAGQSAEAAISGSDVVSDTYFPGGPNPTGAIMFAANAFIAAVFFPSVALLATIASVTYIARMLGEEINLSRITQMV